MRHITRDLFRLALAVSLVVLGFSGCATTSANDPTTVSYPNGTYKLYGDGGATPYYWAWIPNGASAQPAPPTPPPVPAKTAVVIQPTPSTSTTVVAVPSTPSATTTVVASGGQYQLYGNGSTTPYYWVWVPAGTTPPPPPPLPPR